MPARRCIIRCRFASGAPDAEQRIRPKFPISDPQFGRSIGYLLNAPIFDGNKVDTFVNGAEIFPAMIQAIQGAKKTINFETFVYWRGRVGKEFTDALSERARAGVAVHLIIDWFGSFGKIDKDYIDAMKAAGVQVHYYNPLHPYSLSRINHRSHRKLLIIDGLIGFTGGVGIADEWDGNADSPEHWRDTHFRIEGPAVAQMQTAFVDHWRRIDRSILQGDEYFPHIESAGDVLAHVFTSSPSEGSEKVRLMYLMSIAAARESILISNAYFVPDDVTINALIRARKRGVRIEVIVPGRIVDIEAARIASRSQWGKLLPNGIKIYEYQPTMYHCKVMIVDGIWVSVGSTNFDNRSFRLNDEANMDMFDTRVARRQTELFEMDKTKSRLITLEIWQRRPFRERVYELFISPIRSQF